MMEPYVTTCFYCDRDKSSWTSGSLYKSIGPLPFVFHDTCVCLHREFGPSPTVPTQSTKESSSFPEGLYPLQEDGLEVLLDFH